MKNFNNILVVSRMTSYCRKAVLFGVSLARKYDASLYVLHLVSNPTDIMAVNPTGLFNFVDRQKDAKELLDKVIKEEISGGFPIKELIGDHNPLDEIVKAVSEENIDLIVMSAHEEGRFEHALFGGENDAIIRKMPCSILLVKSNPDPVLTD